MRLIMTAKKLTAEELAVKMEMGNHDWADDAAEMLRQQQAEIERLGSELNRIVELYTDKAIENEALKNKLDEQIKNTHELLGWKWKDGDYDTQLKKASEK